MDHSVKHSVNHTVFHTVNHTVKFERFNSVNQRDHSVNTLFFTLCFTVWSHCETQCGPHCVFHSVFHCVDARFSTVWAHCVHSVGTPFTLLKRSNLTLWNIHHTVNNHHTVKHCWKEHSVDHSVKHSVNHTVFHTVNHTVKFERFNSVNQRDHSVNTLFFTLCFTVWSHCETQCGPHCVFHSVFHCVDARFSTVWAHCVHSVGTPFTLLKRSNLTLWNIHHTVNNHHTVKHPLWTTVWTHWPVFWSRI